MKIKTSRLLITFITAFLFQYAAAQPGCIGFNADYTYQPNYTAGAYPNSVFFKNASTWTDSTTVYKWDFGDGVHSYATDVTHYFQTSGTFTVCLYIANINPAGDTVCRDKMCRDITIDFDTCLISAQFMFGVDSNNCRRIEFVPGNRSYQDYRWDLGDFTTAHTPINIHQYSAAGTYNVCLKASYTYDGGKLCTDSSCQSIVVCDALSVTTTELPNIQVYPNPADDELNINTGNYINTRLILTDISGRALITTGFINSAAIDIQHLRSGVYFIELLQNDHPVYRQKVVRQ